MRLWSRQSTSSVVQNTFCYPDRHQTKHTMSFLTSFPNELKQIGWWTKQAKVPSLSDEATFVVLFPPKKFTFPKWALVFDAGSVGGKPKACTFSMPSSNVPWASMKLDSTKMPCIRFCKERRFLGTTVCITTNTNFTTEATYRPLPYEKMHFLDSVLAPRLDLQSTTRLLSFASTCQE